VSLRIPLTPDQTLQVEFHEIERRLRRLEKAQGNAASGSVRIVSGGGSTSVDLTSIYARLDALEAGIIGVDDIPNLTGVGSAAQKGLAPSPGLAEPPTGVAQHLLTEDATWGFPLRGLIGVSTSGEQTDLPYDVVDVLAALHVTGPLSVADLLSITVRVTGLLLIQGGTLATCEDDLSVSGLI